MTAEPGAGPGRLRLRPGVAVTPLREGLHLRGRATSLTLEGSKALPALWELLSARLGAVPQVAPSDEPDPRVEAALTTLTARLREHDLLVEHPDGAELPPWPGSVADRPDEAAAALRTARPVIAAAHPEGPLAQAVARALTNAGVTPGLTADGDLPGNHVLLSAGRIAVAVTCDAHGGFVTSPTTPPHARTDAAAITARLAAPTDGSSVAFPAEPSRALVALLAGAAAQRLLCAVAGLPDPAEHDDGPRLLPGRPAILLAQARPPQGDYHPWVASPSAPGRRSDAPPPGNLAEALRRIAALADPRLGVLDAPRPGGLPQLPAALASCRTPAGTVAAGAARTDLARLEAACLAAELHLAADSFTPIVGADDDHALGRALRRAALALPVHGREPSETSWRDHPQARHWWTALTRHLTAELTLRQFGSEEAYLAVIHTSGTRLLGRSVESTPADAVAMAALAALTRVMADDHGLTTAHHTTMTGATAPLAASAVTPAAWEDEGWTDRWLAGLAAREPALRNALHRLTGLRTAPWRSGHPLAAALRACGFTALAVSGDPQ